MVMEILATLEQGEAQNTKCNGSERGAGQVWECCGDWCVLMTADT